MEHVVLVAPNGAPIGTLEKLAAHRNGGRLHLAFSSLVFDARERLLLQRRAPEKYHFRGLWSNTCCGHPRPGEEVESAARRRLGEEFGFTTELRRIGVIFYAATDQASGLSEREYLHILRGEYEGPVAPAPGEIADWQWLSLAELREAIARAPDAYTPWLTLILESGLLGRP